jgi:small-conductance mechanosensitive channel
MIEQLLDRIASLPAWVGALTIIGAMMTLGLVVHAVVYRVGRIATFLVPRAGDFGAIVMRHIRLPSRFLLPLLFGRFGLGVGVAGGLIGTAWVPTIGRVLEGLIVIVATWLVVRVVDAIEEVLVRDADIDVADNLEARRLRTRVTLLRQMLTAAVVVIGIAMFLLLHPAFRVLGTGILASAGIAGIVIGIAAQQPVRNLLAGVQIAITQPFRVDDVVIVESEWGRIEEITLTYVVIRIWDLRRLVVPIGYFLEKPFQNWTRTSASILGTALLHVDYTAPVEAIRSKLREVAEASPLWDGRVCGLQVTDLRERTMELRALVSAADAGNAWDLRCEVRERLIEFLQSEYPEALPRFRAEATLAGGGEIDESSPAAQLP